MHAQTSGTPRRVRVERGIYRRPSARGGVTYEFTYSDSNGRQRWQTVTGGLREVRAAGAGVIAKLHRGERIAPSHETFEELGRSWLETADLRPRTKETYGNNLARHVFPVIGRRKVCQVSEEDLCRVIASMREKGLSGWTIKGALTPTGRILSVAARRGLISSNPLTRLDKTERPSVSKREMRVLDKHEIGKLLESATPVYRPVLCAALFLGLRQSELLALTWADIDFANGVVHVRRALGRDGVVCDLKTQSSARDVVLMPSLARVFRAHRMASSFKQPCDFVFATATGSPMHWRNVSRRGLGAAVKKAGLIAENVPNFRFHDCRHTFASILIHRGANMSHSSWVTLTLRSP